MKRVIIVHGWAGNPTSNWFPWLKLELERRGVKVSDLSMPDSKHPIQNVWIDYLNENIKDVDENTFFVGHSLGGISILRYLEGLPEDARVGGIVLVASFALPVGYSYPDGFCQSDVDFMKIKKIISNRVVMIHSDNDKYVSNETGRHLHKNLGGNFVVIHRGGHLTSDDGYIEFPEVLEALGSLGV